MEIFYQVKIGRYRNCQYAIIIYGLKKISQITLNFSAEPLIPLEELTTLPQPTTKSELETSVSRSSTAYRPDRAIGGNSPHSNFKASSQNVHFSPRPRTATNRPMAEENVCNIGRSLPLFRVFCVQVILRLAESA